MDFKGKIDLDKYIKILDTNGRSKGTIELYRYTISKFLKHINKDIEDIFLDDLENYVSNVLEGKAKRTIRLHACVIVTFLDWKGLKERFVKLKLPKITKNPPVYLTQDESFRMLQQVKDDPRKYAIISVLLYGGLRRQEVINLDIRDLDFDRDLITIRHSKGDKTRVIPMHTDVKTALLRYIKYRMDNKIMPKDGGDSLFVGDINPRMNTTSLWSMVKNTAIEVGIIKNISVHTLRHTACTHLYRQTKDVFTVRDFAGHSSIKTTEIYVHSDTDQLKKVYDDARLSFTTPETMRTLEDTYKPDPKKHKIDYFG